MKELQQIQKIINDIKDSGEKYDFILAPARGGLVPAQFIAYALGIKTIHTINNVRGGYPRSQPNQKCLLVDDINDTSATIEYIVKHMEEYKLVKSIDVAVIHQRYSAPYKAQYVGSVIHDDHWVNFTWDKELL